MVGQMKNRLVVYTAVFGRRDSLLEAGAPEGADYDRIVFTDDLSIEGAVHVPILPLRDPIRSARLFKIFPHLFLRDYRYSLWVDGSFGLIPGVPLDPLVTWLVTKEASIATYRHNDRNCLYSEANECRADGLDDRECALPRQIRTYRAVGMPEQFGLSYTGILLRDHHAQGCEEFSWAWWEEVRDGSPRDQVSFPFVCWNKKVQPTHFDGDIYDSPLFRWNGHRIG